MGGLISSIANIGSSIVGGAASAVGSVVGGVLDVFKPKIPQAAQDIAAAAPQVQDIAPPPTLLQPASMPSPTSSDVKIAGRRAMAQQLSRKGRSSTIMTNQDALGGQ